MPLVIPLVMLLVEVQSVSKTYPRHAGTACRVSDASAVGASFVETERQGGGDVLIFEIPAAREKLWLISPILAANSGPVSRI
jgi:hypothetical protein